MPLLSTSIFSLALFFLNFTLQAQGYTFERAWGSEGSGPGQFHMPQQLFVNSEAVYVTDTERHNVQKFTFNGDLVSAWTVGGPIAMDSDAAGNLFVTNGYAVDKYSSSGEYISSFGSAGTGNGHFQQAWGIAIDAEDNIYVSDDIADRIQKFSPSGTYISQWGSHGFSYGQFDFIFAIAIDPSGFLYAADANNKRIQKFSLDGTLVLIIQLPVQPSGVSTDALGNVYVSLASESAVYKYASDGTLLATIGSYGTGNGELNLPLSAATDPAGALYVLDAGNKRIQKFTSSNSTAITESTGEEKKIYLYPNPSRDHISVREKTDHISISDLTGHVVAEMDHSPASVVIDLQPGIYIGRISQKDRTYIEKIIIE